jgi:hypothetical protein
MKSRSLVSIALTVAALTSLSGGQGKPEDSVLGTILQSETRAARQAHPEAKLFQVSLVDFVPMALGTDCSSSAEVSSGFLVGNNVRYEEVSGRFSLCDGAPKSSFRISERTFRIAPCKPRYAEEEDNKSCGGQLDEPEAEELHRPIQISSEFLRKTFDSLRNNGIDLGGRYDLLIAAAARVASTAQKSEISEGLAEALNKFRSLNPNVAVGLIRGRGTKTGNGETTVALVDAETGSILSISRSTPLTLTPPTRPQ